MGTRKDAMERDRAVYTARNMLQSKVGSCVLETNKFPDRQLTVHVGRIDKEMRKKQQTMEKEMQLFKNSTLLYNFEPTIIVERPASPTSKELLLRSYDLDQKETPNYMKPLNSRTKTPSNIPTIDAFTIKAKKKVNLWEEGFTKDTALKFRSILGGSPPLSDEEHSDIHKGWAMYRPLSRLEDHKKRPGKRSPSRHCHLPALQVGHRPDSTFITQIDQTDIDKPEMKFSKRSQSRKGVTFSEDVDRAISQIRHANSTSSNRPIQTNQNNNLLDVLQKKRVQPPPDPITMPTLKELKMKKNMKLFEKKAQALGILPLGYTAT